MKLSSENSPTPEIHPRDVRVIKVLGNGRAATAQLVDVTLQDESTIRVVEKVFAPGRLTRLIYRCAFWSPFAYQQNRDAIFAAFYRRRIAAEILRRSGLPVSVAEPRYVRYDQQTDAWVLAADWVEGRGIRPAPPSRSQADHDTTDQQSEIDQRVDIMRRAGHCLHHAGLGGSVWQIDPAALVSTANMLRIDRSDRDEHVIVDLESGIPAFLVPKYLLQSLRGGLGLPFDDLNPSMLRHWVATTDLADDIAADAHRLIDHNHRWKSSEPAPLRRLANVTFSSRIAGVKQEAIRQLTQRRVIKRDDMSGPAIFATWLLSHVAIVGRTLATIVGDVQCRDRWHERVVDSQARRQWLDDRWHTSTESLIREHRLRDDQRLGRVTTLLASGLAKIMPARVQRFVFDPTDRRKHVRGFGKLITSARYQRLWGSQLIRSAIRRWESASRITPFEAASLRRQASDTAVSAYSRGLAFHVLLKFLTPVVAPLKFGSLAVFLYSGNALYLLPMFVLPAARTIVTLGIGGSIRRRGEKPPPLKHALIVGCLPTVGTSAFAIQMAAFQPHLSEFLIRDAASKIGRNLPIYGGADSRTEMACIAACDPLLLVLDRMFGHSPESESEPGSEHDADQIQWQSTHTAVVDQGKRAA